jgi:hypothetical protein
MIAPLRVLICGLSLGAVGCTWGEGEGFATLRGAEVSARIERDSQASFELETELGYAVLLELAELQLDELILEQSTGEGGEAHFDPANPPDGYSLCHGGHCHSDDGRLVDYAEIERELATSGAAFAPLVRLPADARFDLLTGVAQELGDVQPSRELPRAEIARVTLRASALRMRGTVRGGPANALPDAVPLSVELALSAPFRADVHADIDRDTPEHLHAGVELVVPHGLFDAVDFAAMVQDGSVSLSDAETERAEPVLEALAASELRFELH